MPGNGSRPDQSRNVYLPKGKWYNFWTYEVVEGGKEVTVATPLETMPIFVKAGSVIPEYPVMQYVGQHEIEEVKLNIYYTDYEVNSFLFEDYGETFAYEQDIYLEKKFVVNGKSTLTIQQSKHGRFIPHVMKVITSMLLVCHLRQQEYWPMVKTYLTALMKIDVLNLNSQKTLSR